MIYHLIAILICFLLWLSGYAWGVGFEQRERRKKYRKEQGALPRASPQSFS